MFGRQKVTEPAKAPAPNPALDLRASGRRYEGELIRETQRRLGTVALMDTGRADYKGVGAEVPLVISPDEYRRARDAAREVTGEHPAIQMVNGVPQAPVEQAPVPKT